MEKKLKEAQKHLIQLKIDGWLLYDFHGSNDLALHFLEISQKSLLTRRFFYWIPSIGKPIKIVHAIEAHVLDHWPGDKRIYHSWQTFELELKKTLKKVRTAAMEYSPNNAIPYVSRVDAGTVEFIRSCGVSVVTSAHFLPYFTAVLSKTKIQTHFEAAKVVDWSVKSAWKWIQDSLLKNKKITEFDVTEKILECFEKKKCTSPSRPICAVNEHSADPHYEPIQGKSTHIQKGDFILIDLWCKQMKNHSVFADITRVAIAASKPTAFQKKIFSIVKKAQEAAIDLIQKRFKAKKAVHGFEVDDATRKVIEKAGYGKYFLHRTGHSISEDLHGSGAHMDNLEMHDERHILSASCFSIEPGIYLPSKFGVRLEFDILVDQNSSLYITGGKQENIHCLLD